MTAPNRRHLPALLAIGLGLTTVAWAAGPARGQTVVPPTIWDIELGTHVRDLPTRTFVDPACGTNGGPPGRQIGTFDQFALCPVDSATGLHEIWFVYDDLLEYTARARRMSGAAIARQLATTVVNQPVILSLLVDGNGLVQGYRVVTDPAADPFLREFAFTVSTHFKGRFGLDGWDCTDLPRADGETPFGGRYIKERCEKVVDGVSMAVETRLYRKEGQAYLDPHTGQLMTNAFESAGRLDLYRIDRQDVPEAAAAADAALDAEGETADHAAAEPTEPHERFLAGLTRDCPGCDLAGADLRRLDLSGADLSGANLAGAILHRANLRGADLSGANLELANLNKTILTNANLRDANLVRAMLFQADAYGADLSGADLSQASMSEVRLGRATLDGAILNGADLYRARLNDASLVGAELNATDMALVVLLRADLRDAAVESADMMEAQMRGADLTGAVLRRSDLYGADLTATNLSGADFSMSRLLLAKLQGSDQTGTVFTDALMPDNRRHP